MTRPQLSVAGGLASDIRRQLDRDTPELVAFASDLIRVASENPPGARYDDCARIIAARYRELGLAVETLNPSGVGPCVAGSFGAGGRALYFSGHYDVVPAQERSQFEPVVRDGHLRGRGAADMKGGIAAMAFAVRALAQCGVEPAGRLVCLAVPDEETSGPNGTVSLARAGLLEPDALGMLTMEPTSDVVWSASRGVISLRVTVHGKPAHVGLHFEGRNAFQGMLDVAGRFADLGREVSRRTTAYHLEPEAARHSILLLGGELAGGHNFNVVPGRATFTVDRRTNPEEDHDAEREALLRVVEEARARGVDCGVEVFQEGRSAATAPDVPVARALGASIEEVTGRAARFELCPGVCETRHYAALGIPALAYGPGLLSVAHGPEEAVAVEKLVECAEVYALTAARLLSGGPGAAA